VRGQNVVGMNKLIGCGALAAFLSFAASGVAGAQSSSRTPLSPADTYFVTQTSLGTPYQTDSGRFAMAKGGTADIRAYGNLMTSSHIAVNNALLGVLRQKAPVPPPTLLRAAYASMLWSLRHDTGQAFDADYIQGQVKYQHANDALYRYEIANGTDRDLKAFARVTLPKIDDHLHRALRLQAEET
jgi:putative membrane protein